VARKRVTAKKQITRASRPATSGKKWRKLKQKVEKRFEVKERLDAALDLVKDAVKPAQDR